MQLSNPQLSSCFQASGSEAYATELQAQLSDSRSRLEKALTAERVAERRAAAIAQERDALRAALGAASTAASSTSAGAVLPGSLSGQLLAAEQAAAVTQLHALNEDLQKQVAALQAEVAASASAAEAQTMAARTSTTRAEAAEQRIKQLEREADGLAAEVAQLQERLGRGELIRGGGVRVLHLRHNPEAEAKQAAREAAVTQLGAENEALRLQVAELEAAVAALQTMAGAAPGVHLRRAPPFARPGCLTTVSAVVCTCCADSTIACNLQAWTPRSRWPLRATLFPQFRHRRWVAVWPWQ